MWNWKEADPGWRLTDINCEYRQFIAGFTLYMGIIENAMNTAND